MRHIPPPFPRRNSLTQRSGLLPLTGGLQQAVLRRIRTGLHSESAYSSISYKIHEKFWICNTHFDAVALRIAYRASRITLNGCLLPGNRRIDKCQIRTTSPMEPVVAVADIDASYKLARVDIGRLGYGECGHDDRDFAVEGRPLSIRGRFNRLGWAFGCTADHQAYKT